MKTFNRKDIYSWSNSEGAKEYVEQQGYFGNSFQELITNVNNDEISRLWNVFSADEVHCVFEDVHNIRYGLFLPMDSVRGQINTMNEIKNIFKEHNALYIYNFLNGIVFKDKEPAVNDYIENVKLLADYTLLLRNTGSNVAVTLERIDLVLQELQELKVEE